MKALIAIALSILMSSTVTAREVSSEDFEHTYKFPDFGFMLSPEDYHGPVFRLSADFPEKLPSLDADIQNILKIDFQNDWKSYAMAVRDYAFKDNINRKDNELSFDFKGEQSRKWFHVPWQHWGETGREGFHGLTKEGPLSPLQLGPKQKTGSNAYAVGFYNRQGGYAIGKVWENPDYPDLSYVNDKGFPEGTVVAKFLFTTLSAEEVPYLAPAMEWSAYVYTCDIPGNPPSPCDARQQAKVRLLQMDIMVKDSRATESNGWVFGTFVYNGGLGKTNPWENLQPVGLMWGNDPENTLSKSNPEPTETRINPKLKQTRINDASSMPAQHLGWNSRLNGPADNPHSSCMSCHSTAQYPVVSAIMPFINKPPVAIPKDGTTASAAWMRWFRNFTSNEAFDEGQAMTSDFSLQLSKSIQNFLEYRMETQQGCYNAEFWSRGYTVSRGPVKDEDDAGCR